MKKLIFVFLFSALVLFSTARAGNFSSENYPDADRLFAWAEKQYPTLFAPSNGISQVWRVGIIVFTQIPRIMLV